MDIKQIKSVLDSKIDIVKSHIEVIVLNKFPEAIISDYRSFNTIYCKDGMREIDREYHCKLTVKTTAPESSHPDLQRPISRVEITIVLKTDGTYVIKHNYPTDSVDVSYCRFEDKVNRKNITIARKWHRRAIKYFGSTFRKHVPHSGTLNTEETEAMNVYHQYLIESDKLRNELYLVCNRIIPNNKDLRIMRKNEDGIINANLRSSLTLGKELGIIYENHTFYHNGKKLAKRTEMREYISLNKSFFIPDFTSKYPIISSL